MANLPDNSATIPSDLIMEDLHLDFEPHHQLDRGLRRLHLSLGPHRVLILPVPNTLVDLLGLSKMHQSQDHLPHKTDSIRHHSLRLTHLA
jgi:hypothetical protein